MENRLKNSWLWASIGLLTISSISSIVVCSLFPHFFDDAFISFRITENIVNTGKPFFDSDKGVYTSTSLIYPYWNAIWVLIFGPFWIKVIPIVNSLLMSTAVARVLWLVFRNGSRYQKAFFFSVLSVIPLVLGQTQLATGNNGLETALYQLILAFSILPGSVGVWGWIAGFVRPEGFLAGAAIFFGGFFTGTPKRKQFNHLISGLIIFTVWCGAGYYFFGSIIPQSILSKSNYEIDRWEQIHKGYLYTLFQGYGFYAFLIGATWVYFPKIRQEFSIPLIWILFYALFFSFIASWWAWYVPPLLVSIMYLSARSAGLWCQHFLAGKSSAKTNLTFFAAIFVALTGVELSKAILKMRKQSKAYEVRRQSSENVGNWLAKNVLPSETVLLEPLGLIGFYGKKVRFLDYPGLASTEMSTFLNSLPWKIPILPVETRTDSAVIDRFKPDWVLLVPFEVSAFEAIPNFKSLYRKVDSLSYYPAHKSFRQVVFFKKR